MSAESEIPVDGSLPQPLTCLLSLLQSYRASGVGDGTPAEGAVVDQAEEEKIAALRTELQRVHGLLTLAWRCAFPISSAT